MKPKQSIYRLELKWSLKKKRVLFTYILLFLVLLGMFQVRVREYIAEAKEAQKVAGLETQKAAQFSGYTAYSAYGLHFTCLPTPLDFLLAFKIYNPLSSSTDVGTKLNLYEDKKGNNALPDTAGGYLNFLGIFVLAGAIFSSIFGFAGLSDHDRLKYLCSYNSFKKVFLQVAAARMTVVSSFILLLFSATVPLGFINGVNIVDKHYIIFTVIMTGAVNFFLFLGAAHGASKNKTLGKAVLVIVLIFLLAAAPWAVITTGRHISLSISAYRTEFDIFEMLMTFEKSGYMKFGNERFNDDVIKFMKSYRDNELKILVSNETRHRRQMFERADKYSLFAMFFPTTFIQSSAMEFSGKGFAGLFGLYDYTLEKKIAFINYYFDNEYFKKPKPEKVESMLKGDDALFRLEPGFPAHFYPGAILMALYLAAAAATAYIKASRRVYDKQKFHGEEDMFLNITQSQPNTLFTADPLPKNKLYNHLSGKEKLKSQVELIWDKDKDVNGAWNIDFAYLPHPGTLEDIGPKTLHTYLFGTPPDQNMDTWEVMFAFAQKSKLIVMDDFLKGMPPDKIDDILLKIKEKELFCLIISSDYYFIDAIVKDKNNIFCPRGAGSLFARPGGFPT